MEVVGKLIAGNFNKLLVRQKSDTEIELGELLVAESSRERIILQVLDLAYGSQLSQQNLEFVSGLSLEGVANAIFNDSELRNYTLAIAKSVLTVSNNQVRTPKKLPRFFSDIRRVTEADLSFFSKPNSGIYLGKLRSGSKVLDVDVWVDADMALAHHILISAQTGKGKSNLAKVMLHNAIDSTTAGFLVLDPHDEYYGRHHKGLKSHSSASSKVIYYTPSEPIPGARSLVINLKSLKPEHFQGVIWLSDPQWQALTAYYKTYRDGWIEAIMLEKALDTNFYEATLNVVKRRLMQVLSLSVHEGKLESRGVFSIESGINTTKDICDELEKGNIVIIDTSSLSKSVEILIGSLISNEIFRRYKSYKYRGELPNKPVISIVIEEAPRVLGKDVLSAGTNIFETLAREGRKFKIGLVAITQLPSLIPRDILANMNTKIIMGTEMAVERQSLINSAAHDISMYEPTIAALDKGEALVSCSFLKMATPIKVPLFSDIIKKNEENKISNSFAGVKLD